MRGTTKSGFEFEIDTAILDNMELIELVAEAEGEKPLKIVDVLRAVLGEEQKKKLYDHLRDENGRVPTQACTNELLEIFEAAGEAGKN